MPGEPDRDFFAFALGRLNIGRLHGGARLVISFGSAICIIDARRFPDLDSDVELRSLRAGPEIVKATAELNTLAPDAVFARLRMIMVPHRGRGRRDANDFGKSTAETAGETEV